ncbi:right-handed parallel beta-helix repeat-containing protein [Streptomyces sp. NEAU-Y11]|uniref:right-handed parallel beta-helix repeat-containing protein n=1 Tax=Streptomyces cucumeris TaxID=2962890 RepID=UPI0020C8D401|nr:right-handed parallel beta-helix repeat-containing protein [Streptomyces sp. NEAU-Y11]MCP9205491.1 right-handed parallel beta-helix repeat-containing protein [Streptomyces sp. NEAU-Y11]
MTQYTYGGTPADVLTDSAGNAIPSYAVLVYRAGTNELITALYEANGTTPIAELRTNPVGSAAPGAVRTFKVDDATAIEYEYNGPGGTPLRWYQAARELAQEAIGTAADALKKSEGGTVTAPVTLADGAAVDGGLDVEGGVAADGLTVSGNATVSGVLTAGSFQLSGMRIFNPRVYGAVGDGVANDAPAIQSALNAARTAGGGWVLVPAGTYKLASLPLRIYGRTRLTLMPGTRFVRAQATTMLLNGDADQSYGGWTGHGDIVIEGGVWDMKGTTSGLTSSSMCISIGHARGVTVRGVEVRDLPGYHGIEFNSTKNGLIEDCRFLGYVDPGGRDFSEAVQIDLAKSSGAFGGFGPYDNAVCEDIEIRNCYVGASGTAGTTAWPRGIGSHSATVGTAHRRIRIVGNTFEGCLQYGVVAYAYDDCVIQGNTLTGCGSGIRARTIISSDAADSTDLSGTVTNASQAMRNLVIADNTIRNTGSVDDGILLYGESTGRVTDVTITGNVVDTVGGSENGVRIYYAEQYTLSGNLVRSTGGTGISQEQILGATITGNRIYAPGAVGISCDTGTGVLIADNGIRDAGTNGIHVLAGTDVSVQDNYVKGSSRASSGNYGIRISSALDGLKLSGNKVRKYGSGNEAAWGVSITNTCTNVTRWGNDIADSGTSGGMDDQSTQPNTSPFDLTGHIESLMRPSGRYETTTRLRAGTSNTPTSGSLYLVPLWLPKGFTVSSLGFVSGGTAASSPTNWWFTLHNSAKVAVARTADQTTTAWAANTAKSVAIAQTTAGSASSYVTTYTGLHYIGVMIKATTVPSLVSEGSVADILASVSPGFGGTDAGLSTPPTVTSGAFTAGAFGTGSGILLYGYAT